MNKTLDLNCNLEEFWKIFEIDDDGNISFKNKELHESKKQDLITYIYLKRFEYEKEIQKAMKENYDNFVKEGKFAANIEKFVYKDIDYSITNCEIYGKQTDTYKGIDVLNHVIIETTLDKLESIFNNKDYVQFKWSGYTSIMIEPNTILSSHLKELRIFNLKIIVNLGDDCKEGGWANDVFENHKNAKATLQFNTGKVDFNYQDDYNWTMRKEVFKVKDNLGGYFKRHIFWGKKQIDYISTSDVAYQL